MFKNLDFRDFSQGLFRSKTAMVEAQASMIALKICWRSSLKYFGIQGETVKEREGVEDLRRTEASETEIGFSELGEE